MSIDWRCVLRLFFLKTFLLEFSLCAIVRDRLYEFKKNNRASLMVALTFGMRLLLTTAEF